MTERPPDPRPPLPRQRVWTVPAVIAMLVAAQLLPAHYVVRVWHDFEYVKPAHQQAGEFVPDTYIWPETRKWKVLLWRFDIHAPASRLVLLQFDSTVLETDEGFASFIIDELRVESADGTSQWLIAPSLPVELRTFAIEGSRETGYSTRTFERAVRPADVTIHESGTAIRDDGTRVPFRKVTHYEYHGRAWDYIYGFLELALRT